MDITLPKSDDLVNYIGQHKSVGDNVTLTVYRNGHAIDLKTTLVGDDVRHFHSLLSISPTIPSFSPSFPIQPPIIP